MSITRAIFKSLGKIHVRIDKFIKCFRGERMLNKDSLTNLIGIPSWPELIVGLSLLTILTISLSSTGSIKILFTFGLFR